MAPIPNVPNEEGTTGSNDVVVASDNINTPESRLKKKASSSSLELTKDEVSVLLASLTKPPVLSQTVAPGAVVSCISKGMNGLKSKHLGSDSEEPKLKRDRLTVFGTRYCPWTHRVLLVAAKKGIE